MFSAAGDNGSDDCNTQQTATPIRGQNPVSVDDPASQPYVLGVGGTAIDAASSPPLEHVWNDGAGGGGRRRHLRVVADAVVAAALRGAGHRQAGRRHLPRRQPTRARRRLRPRLLPGARAGGDARQRRAGWSPTSRPRPTSTPARSPSTRTRTPASSRRPAGRRPGGTSSSAPIWAATLALVNASPTCRADRATARGVGFAAPLLYRVASDPAAYAASFTDVRAGSNDTYGISNGKVFAATRGYDPATGLGSPLLTGSGGTAGLAYYLCSLARSPSRPAVTESDAILGQRRRRRTGANHRLGLHVTRAVAGRLDPGRRTTGPGRQSQSPQRPHDPGNAPVRGPGLAAQPARVRRRRRAGPGDRHAEERRFQHRRSKLAIHLRRSRPRTRPRRPSPRSPRAEACETRSGSVTILGSGFTGVRRDQLRRRPRTPLRRPWS